MSALLPIMMAKTILMSLGRSYEIFPNTTHQVRVIPHLVMNVIKGKNMNGKNSTLKIPLFTPFQDVQQGMDALIKTINKVKDDSVRTELAIIYGCLGSTLNQIYDDCECSYSDEYICKGRCSTLATDNIGFHTSHISEVNND
jgi:hypothetical protein